MKRTLFLIFGCAIFVLTGYHSDVVAEERKHNISELEKSIFQQPTNLACSLDFFAVHHGDNLVKGTVDSANQDGVDTGSVTSDPGYGARIGLRIPNEARTLDWGISIGYVNGPHVWGTISGPDLGMHMSQATSHIDVKTDYWRFMLEGAGEYRFSALGSLRLGAGLGMAIADTQQHSRTVGDPTVRFPTVDGSRSSTGLTLELSPAIVINLERKAKLEIGLRIAEFPAIRESNITKHVPTWDSTGIYIGMSF